MRKPLGILGLKFFDLHADLRMGNVREYWCGLNRHSIVTHSSHSTLMDSLHKFSFCATVAQFTAYSIWRFEDPSEIVQHGKIRPQETVEYRMLAAAYKIRTKFNLLCHHDFATGTIGTMFRVSIVQSWLHEVDKFYCRIKQNTRSWKKNLKLLFLKLV